MEGSLSSLHIPCNLALRALEEMSIMAILLDEQGHIVYANETFETLTQLAPTSYIKQSFLELLDEDCRDCLEALPDGESRRLWLKFANTAVRGRRFVAHLHSVQGGFVLFGERPFLSDDDVFARMSLLNNDLMNMSRELRRRNRELEQAQERIKTLSGLIPICASCKKIRDDKGYWEQVEVYVGKHSDAVFSHAICPDCMKKLYGDLLDDVGGVEIGASS